MTTTPKAAAEKSSPEVVEVNKEENTIPAQVSGNTIEIVNGEPPLKEKLVNRVKGLAKNKRVIASVSSVALIAAGVLVARKRNTPNDEDVAETSEA